ncbi:MAG TPA: MmcQ/YjbR family DNA-binding protein [Permianibacter sp.]|nr:MmcQ/YjbR family DNA-binding protein [Permianibacter sp.]
MTASEFAALQASIAQQALALPGSHHDIKWGSDRVLSVHGKMFCCLSVENGVLHRISVKAPAERFLELTDQPGIVPAPYLAKHHWVSLLPEMTLTTPEVLAMVREAYAIVRANLSKKVQASLAAIDATPISR